MPTSVTKEHTVGIIRELHNIRRKGCQEQHKIYYNNTSLLVYLDIKDPKTRWMYISKRRETFVGDQIPVSNLRSTRQITHNKLQLQHLAHNFMKDYERRKVAENLPILWHGHKAVWYHRD